MCVAKETPKSHSACGITKPAKDINLGAKQNILALQENLQRSFLTVPSTEEWRRIFLQTIQVLFNILNLFLYVVWKRSHYFHRYICLNNTVNHGLPPCPPRTSLLLLSPKTPSSTPCRAVCDVNSLAMFLFEKGFRKAKLHGVCAHFT